MKAGWTETRIGDVCIVIAGQSPEGSAYNDQAVGLPFYQGKKEFGERLLGAPTTWTTITKKEALAGDILMSVRAPVGPINEATTRICIGRGLAAIRAKTGLNRDFLWYALLWLQPSIKGSAGAVFDSINKAGIESLPIPLPPLEEQQQIVAVLDEAFEGLSRARAHAEANLRDARELFATVLDELLGQEIPTWCRKSIAEVCLIGDGNHSSKYPRNSEMVSEGVPFIRSSNIQNGRVDRNEMLFISAEKHNELKKGHLKTDDILFTNRGEIGKVAIVPAELDGSNLNSQVAWLRCRELLSHRFLYFFLQSRNLRKHYLDTQSGAALQQFTIRMLKDVQVSFPPLDDQEGLVERVVEIQQATENLETAYARQVSDIDALRQSLLQKAFAGELT